MPFPKRLIEPIYVTRGTLPEDLPLPSELEGVTNGTLANTVRQLSSLSRHAEDLFGELARDAQQLYDRSNSLQARIDRLSVKVTQLDSTVEEVSLQDIHMRKAFKSATVFDQQIFSRATMPTAMLETYNSCDRPPPLDKLNCYRDDGKDGLKFYTDPNYFFELWRDEMLNDTERVMHDKGKNRGHRGGRNVTENNQSGNNRHKKRVRQPHNTRERQKQIARDHGEYIMPPQNTIYRSPQQLYEHTVDGFISHHQPQQDPSRPPRPNSIEIRRSYQREQDPSSIQQYPDGMRSPLLYQNNNNSNNNSQIMNSDEHNVYQQDMYGQGPLSSESLYSGGTPTRGNANKSRPSQPPPAPPSNQGTPTSGTPTRNRNMSSARDQLPPPPPPPEAVIAGASSPPLPLNGLPIHMNRLTDSPHHLHRANTPEQQQQQQQQQLMLNHSSNQDLPPPPPAPPGSTGSIQQQQEYNELKQATSPPKKHIINSQLTGGTASGGSTAASTNLSKITNNLTTISSPPPPPLPITNVQANVPPPPPPPPMPTANIHVPPVVPIAGAGAGSIGSIGPISNGDLIKALASPPKLTPVKDRVLSKLGPPLVDPRNDLLKAIRDGIKLRKVEKNEQRQEVDRGVNGLHDVASILARRVAVEFSDSESGSDSECDSEGWGENETSA